VRSIVTGSASKASRRNAAYVLTLAVAVMTFMGAVAAFNWWRNPFNVFPPSAAYFADFPHPRISKAYLPVQLQPQTVIMGTSRAEVGIPAHHEGWNFKPVFNMGLSGTSFAEIATYFEHAVATSRVRQAIVMLDYGACDTICDPQPTFDPQRLATLDRAPALVARARDAWMALATWDALASSTESLRLKPEQQTFLPTGERNESEHYRKIRAKGGLTRSFQRVDSSFPRNSTATEKNWEPLHRTIRAAAAENVTIVWVITPYHDHLWRLFAERDGLEALLDWRREVVKRITSESKSAGLPPPAIWDFDGTELTRMSVAAIQEEAAAARAMPLFFEYSHFSTRVGRMMLDRMLLDKPAGPEGFGVRVSEANVEDRLRLLRRLWMPNPTWPRPLSTSVSSYPPITGKI
jgi:hypothetical protein